MIFRDDVVKFFSRSQRIARLFIRNNDRRLRQLGDELSDLLDATLVVSNSIVRDARQLVVRTCAAESFVVDRLSRRAFNEIRTTETHERRTFNHYDNVRQRREVRATGNAWS